MNDQPLSEYLDASWQRIRTADDKRMRDLSDYIEQSEERIRAAQPQHTNIR